MAPCGMSKLTPKTEKAKRLFVDFPMILKPHSWAPYRCPFSLFLTYTHTHTHLTAIYEILIFAKFIKFKILMEKTLFPNSEIKRSMLFDCGLKFAFYLESSQHFLILLKEWVSWDQALSNTSEYKSLSVYWLIYCKISKCIAVAHLSPVISWKGIWGGGGAL